MNWHIWKCSGIVCSCSTERGIRERENEMSGIVIEKVRKSFDTKDGVVEALKDVNLNIDSGDIYGIIGMSGAGKSTLVRCMNFLEIPTEGHNALKTSQKVLQPGHHLIIQMVGRLVQKQHITRIHQSPCQCHPFLLSPG